ncbi:MAG: hypothetical protein J6Q38_04305, partial [Clostridia bacterium]|nr:hypothetical protein [Clostridia bacterium]
MITEKLKVLNYELKGELPNPFIFDDGKIVKTKSDWEKRRKEMYKSTIDLQFGTMPPKPEFLDIEPLYVGNGNPYSYKITTGTKASPVTFVMYVFRANLKKKAPVVISGDMCFPYYYNLDYLKAFSDNGIDLVLFNRCELAPDIAYYNLVKLIDGTYDKQLSESVFEGLTKNGPGGQLKKAYPNYTFGTIGAWAWGYSRCVDALEKLGYTDMSCVAFTGHSRGGKTSALAGAIDERATIVHANSTCAGGYSGYRINIEAETQSGNIAKSEDIAHIFEIFPSWMGSELRNYINKEELLPFDSHYLKAMVAPRVLLVTEASSDIMGNSVGSYQTTEAALEVYKFLDVEKNLYWHFRDGSHYLMLEDLKALINLIKHLREGEPLNENFYTRPF